MKDRFEGYWAGYVTKTADLQDDLRQMADKVRMALPGDKPAALQYRAFRDAPISGKGGMLGHAVGGVIEKHPYVTGALLALAGVAAAKALHNIRYKKVVEL